MKKVEATIITIGDELLIGQTVDTNSAWIGQELNRVGVWVKKRIAVGDVKEDIAHALDEARRETSIIILTGGLGPTADDITKPILAEYFKTKLVQDENVLKNIRHLFENVYQRKGPLLERNIRQAMVPELSRILMNEQGTAPGMWFDCEPPEQNSLPPSSKQVVISLPGVPNEMKWLMNKYVLPALGAHFELPAIHHRSLLTAGIGESMLADHIKEWEENLPSHIRLAYLPHFGTVRLRLTGTGKEKMDLEKEIEEQFFQLRGLVQKWLVSDEDKTLPATIAGILDKQNKTVATAESCTGGYIAHLLSRDAGSSNHFYGAIVCYDKRVKETLLDVPHHVIEKEGTVNETVARGMVKGLLGQMDADYAIATTGLMGPDSGEENKPVGTAWIAVGDRETIEAKEFHFRFERPRNIEQMSLTALNMFRIFLENKG